MANGTSKSIPMKLSFLLSMVCLPISVFVTSANAIGSVFPIAVASTSPSASGRDSSFVAAIITITEDAKQNTVFRPQTTNITQGEEIFIGNNSSSPQSITSGSGPEDPLSGKLFDTGVIKPKGYAEFVTANLSPGSYPYYSSTNTSVKGTIIVQK